MIRIALAGNPNSGKTTLFNNLTGSNQYVGNWPGVTVERKEGKCKGYKDVLIQDLPGIYSLSPYTLEEVVSRDYLLNDKPDCIINIVDGSNIERNLYLTTQLIELGLPVVIAINMIDVVRKLGDKIDLAALSNDLGCEVVEISALRSEGVDNLLKTTLDIVKSKKTPKIVYEYSSGFESVLANISTIISDSSRFKAIKVFEKDSKLVSSLALSSDVEAQLVSIINAYEEEMDDDCESIVTDERYKLVSKIVSDCVVKAKRGLLSTSDKIDAIVTNRFLALPIFALVMYLVYYISIQTVGTAMTDWVNEVLFGEIIPPALEAFLESINTAPWLIDMVINGILAGVGGVLGFLPQMMVLFLCLAILEDTGYMARVAFIMDRIFRKFGLSGKSFIPMMIATGCAVPGIMASRTIENENDRKMTIITTSFMPCGAKLPIIALIAGAIFDDAAWVSTSVYFLAIASIIVSGLMLKKTKMFAGEASPFVMELPAYHMPSVKNVLFHVYDRSKSFVLRAGSLILVASIVIWFTGGYSFSFEAVDADASILASIGNVLAPLFKPLGWGFWQPVVASFAALSAKEVLVTTMGILYGVAEVAEDGVEIWGQFAQSFSPLAAYSFLAFNLLCAPCFAAIGATRREMGSAKWTWFALAYQCGFAYAVAFLIYQFGTFYVEKVVTVGFVMAIVVLVIGLYLLFRPAPKQVKKAVLATANK